MQNCNTFRYKKLVYITDSSEIAELILHSFQVPHSLLNISFSMTENSFNALELLMQLFI